MQLEAVGLENLQVLGGYEFVGSSEFERAGSNAIIVSPSGYALINGAKSLTAIASETVFWSLIARSRSYTSRLRRAGPR